MIGELVFRECGDHLWRWQLLAPRSSARLCRALTVVVDRSLWLEVEKERENRARTHSISTSAGRSSAEEMAKLNSLAILSYSEKL